jgi:Xaa-Pro aminopeptidase
MSGLTPEGCRDRRARLWSALPQEVQWLLVADPRHVYYLANLLVNPLSFSAGERAWLLLLREGFSTLLADNFTRRASATVPGVDEEITESFYDHKHSVANRDELLIAALARVVPRLRGLPGLYEDDWVPGSAVGLLAGADASAAARSASIRLGSLLRRLRRNKHADELDLLKSAMAAGAAGHARALVAARPGITEFELYCQIEAAVLEAAARPVQIYGDFRATNAATPKRGGLPSHAPLGAGDLYLLDYSVVIDGYRSDITNTVSVGVPSAAQRALFDACQQALAAGEASIRPGARAAEVYRAIAGALAASPHAATFSHHAGHGIGLAHPEPPILVPQSEDVLEEGDVITLEPGLYAPGVGGLRLEHNYLVVEGGCQRLSQHELRLC